MSDEKILRPEMVFVIPWDPDKNTIYLQRKDGTYWVEPYCFKYCFVGTGVVSEHDEKPFSALVRKLRVEMTDAQHMITDEMRFWKSFRFRWEKSVVENEYAKEEEYVSHVFVRMMSNQYEMMRLQDAIRGRGKKRATPEHIRLDEFAKIQPEKFLGSLDIVASDFLKEIENGSDRFWKSLEKGRKV